MVRKIEVQIRVGLVSSCKLLSANPAVYEYFLIREG